MPTHPQHNRKKLYCGQCVFVAVETQVLVTKRERQSSRMKRSQSRRHTAHKHSAAIKKLCFLGKQTQGVGKVYRGLGDQLNGPFTSLLLAVSSLPAPCLPTSSRGSFLSLSPSIRTRTTPDLSTISCMTLPLLPITLPERNRKTRGLQCCLYIQYICGVMTNMV